jgi:histidine triad (HIT) family protein
MTTDVDCLFCNMAKGRFPVDKLHEDSLVFAIRDINPRAPTHLLIISRQHIPTAHHLSDAHSTLLGHMVQVANKLMDDLELSDRGYRLAFNVGEEGGQTIYHLHLHVLGGRRLGAEG